jgi:hypothetical protein
VKTITITYAVPVEVEVPDDFPVPTEDIQHIAHAGANRFEDGRHNFSTELMLDGAERMLHGHVESALEFFYQRKVNGWFGKDAAYRERRDGCDMLAERWRVRIGRYVRAREVKVTVIAEDTQACWERRSREYDERQAVETAWYERWKGVS